MSAHKAPESMTTVRQHGDSVEGSGVRVEGLSTPPPRRPIKFPIEMPGLPIDGAGLAIARSLRESA